MRYAEDTDDTIKCPHCGALAPCLHLLAVLDRTFGACSGGYCYERYADLTEQIETAFIAAMDTAEGEGEDVDWDTEEFRDLWQSARESHDEKSGYFAIEPSILVRVIAELLTDAGGEEFVGPATEGDVHGMLSSISVFHAEDPKAIFEKACEDLTVHLRQV